MHQSNWHMDFNNQRPLIIDKAHVPDEADQIEDNLYYGFLMVNILMKSLRQPLLTLK